MKTLTLKETQAPYTLALDEALLADEVVILEKDGQPLAALVPIAEYEAFQAWRDAENRRQARQQDASSKDHPLMWAYNREVDPPAPFIEVESIR